MYLPTKVSDLFTTFENFREKTKLSPLWIIIISVLLAVVIQHFVHSFFSESTPLLMFVFCVFISAWYGGFKYGIAATILSVIVADYLFLPPRFLILGTQTEISRMFVFSVQGIIISFLSESRFFYEYQRNLALNKEKESRITAEKAVESRDQFISMVSHELKNPLASQKAYLQLLKKKPQIKIDTIDKLESQTNRMIRIVSDLLTTSKLSIGKLQMEYDTFDLSAATKQIVDEVGHYATNRHNLIFQAPSNCYVYADKIRIEQVISNLISNAQKYSPSNSTIKVVIQQNPSETTVSVKDYGIGIHKKNQEKIFEKYYRVHGTDETNYKGFGMGLYVAYQIIKMHNSHIKINSRLNYGSTFSFKLKTISNQSTAD